MTFAPTCRALAACGKRTLIVNKLHKVPDMKDIIVHSAVDKDNLLTVKKTLIGTLKGFETENGSRLVETPKTTVHFKIPLKLK